MRNYIKLLRGRMHTPVKWSPKTIHYTPTDALTKYTTYAIVGNGPVHDFAANEIDQNDIVIRFNFPKNAERTGTRTDVIVFANHENCRYALKANGQAAEAIKSARELWLPTPQSIMLSYLVPVDEVPRSHFKHNNWTYSLIWQHGLKKTIFGVDEPTYLEFCKKLMDVKSQDQLHCPSSGFMAICSILKYNAFAKITLYGFSHAGWPGHSWEAEKAYVDELTRQGIVQRFGHVN